MSSGPGDETPDPNLKPDLHTAPSAPGPSDNSVYTGVPWTLTYTVAGIAAVILAGVALLVLHWIYESSIGDISPAVSLLALGGMLGTVQMVVSYWLGPLSFGLPLSSLGLRLPTQRPPAQLAYTILALGGSIAFIAVYTAILKAAGLESLQPEQGLAEDAILGGTGVVASALMVVIIAPFTEEVFFRGFIFPALYARLGLGWALAASGAIFAVFHVDPKVMLPIFVTGALLAWLYHKTGSIWPPFIAHALQNGLALAVTI